MEISMLQEPAVYGWPRRAKRILRHDALRESSLKAAEELRKNVPGLRTQSRARTSQRGLPGSSRWDCRRTIMFSPSLKRALAATATALLLTATFVTAQDNEPA